MTAFFDLQHTVKPDEIDAQAHVHNLRYLQWTLWAAGRHSEQCGWNREAARAEGFSWVVRSHEIKYRAPARDGDQITVRTWVADLQRFASRRKCVVYRSSDQTVLCQVTTRWVYVDLNSHTVVPIPEDIQAQIQVLTTPPPQPWETS